MRRVACLAVLVSGVIGFAAACGIDEGGLLPPDASQDVGASDVNAPDIKDVVLDIPMACQTLDATACLDASVPDGWTLVALATSSTICPTTADWTPASFVYNLQADNGDCTCSCTPTGQYSCEGPLTFHWSGSTCSNQETFDAGQEGGCFQTGQNDPNAGLGTPTTFPSGGDCDAGTPSSATFTSSPVTSCVPKCTADYCGTGGSFKRCVISSTATNCPPPFAPALQSATPPGQIGPSPAGYVTCAGCGCVPYAVPPICKTTFAAYSSPDCTTGLLDAALPMNQCNQNVGGGVKSVFYTPTDPIGNCNSLGGGPSGVGFTPGITVCCM